MVAMSLGPLAPPRSEDVELIEVAPRDGLQNEAVFVPTASKVAFVNAISRSGLREIEVSAFVSPKWMPQLCDAEAVFAAIQRAPGVIYSALVPNARGLERAIAARVDKLAVLTAASEAFTWKNQNSDIAGTLRNCGEVARQSPVPVRGYVSTVVSCPFSGPVPPSAVLPVVERLFELGCMEVSLGDTMGRATSDEIARLLELLVPRFGAERFALHLHDLSGQAVAGCRRALSFGVRRFDCATTARAGCPYAPGAGGNVSTLSLAAEFGVPLRSSELERAVRELGLASAS
jgi:hydroxymethylglutaryl-CoA lyase